MVTSVKVKGIVLTPAIRTYVESKVALLEKHLAASEAAKGMLEVEIGQTSKHHRSGHVFQAEFRLILPGSRFYAKMEEEDLYAAIDLAKDEMVAEVTKARKKKITLLKHGGREIKKKLRRLGF